MPSAIERLIGNLVEGGFDVFESDVSVSTVGEQVLRSNPERVAWTIVNTGGQEAQIGFREPVSTLNGIPLAADGGGAESSYLEHLIEPSLPLFARTAVGSTNLHVEEIVRVSSPRSEGV